MLKDFNKIVNKLWKKWWNVIFKSDIFEIIDPELKSQYKNFVTKTIYALKAKGYIISLKSWVYIVPEKDDEGLNRIDLIEKYYLKLLKKYISQQVWSEYYISWVKSLQFHLKDMSIPSKIYITTRSLNKKIQLWDYEIIFKTISGKYQWKKINLYTKLSRYKKVIQVDWIELKISWLELSMLEAALVADMYEWLDISLLVKAVKKYGGVLNSDIFRDVGKYKYNMSCNRLKEISKTINHDLYEVFLDIIKQNWGCFIWEGMRAM